MDIKDCHIGQRVMTEIGRIGTVDAISRDSVYVMFGSSVCQERMHACDLTPVSEPCASCEMAATITGQCKQIADLQVKLDEMTCKSNIAHRNARYWREELEKLQNEALAECKPLSEDAKIICELLEGFGPLTSLQIAERLHLLERCILENLIEAREAGRIQLVSGKYEIVRD